MTLRLLAAIALSATLIACGPSTDVSSPAISGVVTAPEPTASLPRTPTTLPDTDVARSPEPSATTPTVVLSVAQSFEPLSDVVADHFGNRLLVIEQRGVIYSLSESKPAAVLDISHLTRHNGEQGLLGAAISVDGDSIYLNYTSSSAGSEGDTVIAAAPRTADGSFDSNNLATIMTISQPYGNHNGGDLEVLADGSLLIAVGDGGSGGDPQRHAHNLDDPLGKLLRIVPLAGGGYVIPNDNPYLESALGEIWSSGLRNPWRIDVDPLTADLWVADVGQNEHEEVNRVEAFDSVVGGKGIDFGWSSSEGFAPFNRDVTPDTRAIEVSPSFTYPHTDGACSITGGVVYRGELIDDLWGWYVFADYCTGVVSAYNYITDTDVQLATVELPTAIERDHHGEIVITTGRGEVVSVVRP